MVGAGIDDLITGRQRTTADYLSIWAQNTIGGAQIGASIDVAAMSGGLALPASGALGAAGFDALTFGGEAQTWGEFGKSQMTQGAIGAVLGPIGAKVMPAAGAVLSRIPGARQAGTWAMSKVSQGAQAIASRYVRTEADDVLAKPFTEVMESASQLPTKAREAIGQKVAQARQAIGQKLDDYAVRQEAAIQKAIDSGRQGELGVLGPGGQPASSAPTRPVGASRPTPRQSEVDVETLNPGHRPQVSFRNGREVPYSSRGSVRPDAYRVGEALEVKNYNLLEARSRAELYNRIQRQYLQRASNLPRGTHQRIVIDIRGQTVPEGLVMRVRRNILTTTRSSDVTVEFLR